jgi:hypothetical protein
MGRIRYIARTLWSFSHTTFGRYLLTICLAVLILTGFAWGVAVVIRRRKQRLTYLIAAEKRKIIPYRVYDHLVSTLRDIYSPSLSSLAIIILLLFVPWFLVFRLTAVPTADDLQLIARLQVLDTGIALVFVPFTLFAVGLSSRRTESGVTAAEVLLRETYVFPITVFVLGLLATFTTIKRPSLARAIVFVTLSLAVLSIYRLCLVLLDEQKLYTSAIRLLQDKIKRTIGGALEERIGKNLLMAWLEDKPIEYSLGLHMSEDKYFKVTAPSRGIVRDVYLDQLGRFAEELEAAANESGFAYDEKQGAEELGAQQEETLTEVRAKKLTRDQGRYIVKLFMEPVSERADVLVWFSRSLVPDAGRREQLAKRVRKAFRIRSGDSSSQQVERYLNLIKDEAISAIRDCRTAYLDSVLAVFTELVTTFLEEMKKAIGGHSYERAVTESSALFGGWNEMRWMSRHLFEIHDRGCRSGDIFIARTVIDLPARIAYSSIRFRDLLVFDQFTAFVQRQYSLIDDIQNEAIKVLLFERCSQHLKDLGDVGIAIELEEPENSPENIERIRSFATVLLVRFIELMRLSFDKSQFEHFREFNSAMNGLLQHISSRHEFAQASVPGDGGASLPGERASLSRERERRKAILKALEELDLEKRQSLFAIGSYVFEKALRLDNAEARKCLEQIDAQLPTNPTDQAELYIGVVKPKGAEVWGRALYPFIPDGAWLDSNSVHYLGYLLLKATHGYTDQQFGEIELPSVPDFVTSLRADGPIGSALSQFSVDRGRWKLLIPDDWLGRIPQIQSVFDRALAKRTAAEEDAIISASLDQDYVRGFRTRFVTAFEKHAVLRQLFRRFGAYKDSPDVESALGTGVRWGLNLLDFKEAYTAAGRRKYFNWPEEYARNLANSESEYAFHQLLQQLPECDLTGAHGLERKIDAVASALKAKKLRCTALFVARQSPFGLVSQTVGRFTPYWLLASAPKRTPEFLGELRMNGYTIPVFAIWTSLDANFGCAVELPRSIVWEQLPAAENANELNDVQGPFWIHLVDFSIDINARKELANTNPEWLKPRADKERYLSLRVWLRALERFQLNVIDKNRGLRFNLAD